MPESSKHMMFVDKLLDEAKRIVPTEYHVLICSDKPDSTEKPPRTKDGFVPDLYYNHNNLLIIGEAKTAEDVDRFHSKSQYQSYFEEALRYEGKAILIFASPWYAITSIKNTIKQLNRKNASSVEARFLTEIGEAVII